MSLDRYLIQYPDPTQWTVSKSYHHFCKVIIRPDGTTGTARWIANLKQLLPSLASHSPVELLESIRTTGGIDLGTLGGREAHQISTRLRQSGTIVDLTDASFIAYLPTVDGNALFIEDDMEAETFSLRLIELGAKVVHTES